MQESEAVPSAAPPGECRAVVDVGTNSVKLLVARVHEGVVDPILEKGNQTRLGEGFFATRRLQPAAIARTANAIAAFCREARSHHPASLRVVATAAAREAENRDAFLEAVRPVLGAGIELEVISGSDEADLAFRGVCTESSLAHRSLLVADVGGGSTELILGDAGVRRFSHSFAMGAVREMESLRLPESPSPVDLHGCRTRLEAYVTEHVIPALRDAPPAPQGAALEFVGVGGTAAVLASIVHGLERYDRVRIESTVLTATVLAELTTRLWSLPLAERRRLPGLPPERADIILTGSAIYEVLVRVLNLAALRPSTRGLRFAALLDRP